MKKYLQTKWIKIILFVLFETVLLTLVFYAGIKLSVKKEISQSIPSPTFAPTPSPEGTEEEQIVVSPAITKVTPPATFGYTKIIDLPGIGIRALFPPNTRISYSDPSTHYIASAGPYDTVSFTIKDYSGGSRRSWFRENYGWPNNLFESFSAKNHSGYISYFKDQNGNPSGPFFYFSLIRPNKMLVVESSNSTSSNYFFATNIVKFKSFLSTIQIITPNPQGVQRPDQFKIESNQRWSEIRKTVWEREDLGLRVTAPEWIESRYITKMNEDGTWTYSPWVRIYPEAKTEGNQLIISGLIFGGTSLRFLDAKYTGKSFNEVVNEILPGAGFCSTGWKISKSECTNPDYCYTKDEVIKNLILRKTAKFGPYTGQLRGINSAFSQKRDCRGEDIWLIQARGGQFVLSTIYPDGETIRLEGF